MIIHTFDKETKEIIKAEKLVRKRADFPKFFISSFSGLFTKKIKELFKAEEICSIHLNTAIPVFSFEYEGEKIGYFESPMGAPAAVIAEEEVFAMGAEEILYFGSCGYLDEGTEPASFLIPYQAYRDEGTSYHYMSPCDFIDIDDNHRLRKAFDEMHVPYESIRTWTTDGFFRETEKNMEKQKQNGCSTVEMECAALMACAQFRGKKAYQFLYATDFLTSDYDLGLLKRLPGSFAEYVIEVAAQSALILIRDED